MPLKPPPINATWTDEMTELTVKLWQEGQSASKIMHIVNEAFGKQLTRSAVIGKIHRTGNSGRTPNWRGRKRRPKAPVAPEIAAQHNPVETHRTWWPRPKSKTPVVTPVTTPDAGKVYDASRQHLTKSIIEIEDHECRWPFGDPKHDDFALCAAPRIPGHQYCAHHVQRSRADSYTIAPTHASNRSKQPETVD